MPPFTPTGWRFVTSEGLDAMVSLGLAVGGQAGRLYVRDPRRREYRFQYICMGGGLGVGLRAGHSWMAQILRTVSLDVFTAEMTSGNIGTIWKGAGAGRELDATDFLGDCIMLVGQAGAVGGGSVTLIICAPPGTLQLVGMAAASSALTGPAALHNLALTGAVAGRTLDWCKCIGMLYGTSVGAQLGAGVLSLYGTLAW
jgi:hypothetical protein